MKKFSMLMAAALVGLTASAADYYVIGGFNNWALKAANCKFTEVSETEYVLDYNGTLTSGFKINDGTWSNDAANWGSNGSDLVLGQAYVMTAAGNSGNITMSENVANPHLVFDPTTGTLTITGQSQEAVYTYDIWGNLDGGSAWSSTTLTESNGVWTADVTVDAAANFGIRQLSEGAQVAWISHDGNGKVVVNTPMQCKVDGTNFSIAAGEYTFAFDPEAMTLTVTGEGGGDVPIPPTPTTTWNLIGDFCDWDVTDPAAMTMVEEGVWTITKTLKDEFKFVEGNSWANNLGAESALTLTKNGTYNLISDGKNFKLETEQNVTITLDVNARTVKIEGLEGGGDDPIPPTPTTTWNLIGDFCDWDVTDPAAMTMVEEGVWTITKTLKDEFKFVEGNSWANNLGAEGEENKILTANGTYNVVAGGKNFKLETEQNVTITLDVNAGTVKIEGIENGDEPVVTFPETMYVVGDMFTWDIQNPTAMTTVREGVYTITVECDFPEGKTPNFRMLSETGDWDTVNQYGARNAKGESGEGNLLVTFAGGTEGEWHGTAYKGNKDNWQFDVTELNGDKLQIVFDMHDMQVSFGKESDVVVAVETINAANGEAIYFNLQGARVANPENGLFIRVANGKAQKVVVK